MTAVEIHLNACRMRFPSDRENPAGRVLEAGTATSIIETARGRHLGVSYALRRARPTRPTASLTGTHPRRSTRRLESARRARASLRRSPYGIFRLAGPCAMGDDRVHILITQEIQPGAPFTAVSSSRPHRQVSGACFRPPQISTYRGGNMHHVKSRSVRVAAAWIGACAALSVVPTLHAQSYPERSIRLIVPFPPGGQTDNVSRQLGNALASHLRQQVVIDNRSGASGTIGSTEAAHAQPDGYTLLMGTASTHAINPTFMTTVAYDAVKDF